MTTLVLIRHARVIQDRARPVAEWDLSDEGRAAAAVLRVRPEFTQVRRFFSSPELKARVTARIIADGRPITAVSDLRELDRSAAGWVGSEANYRRMVEHILQRPAEAVRGCEPAGQARSRMVQAIDDIIARHPRETVALVSHGIVLTLYLMHFLEQPEPDLERWRRMRFPDMAVLDLDSRTLISDFGAHDTAMELSAQSL